MYGLIALATAIENVFPPTPSDVAVAIGAFLSHDGVTSPVPLFLVAWGSSMTGALAVYAMSRRYGRTLFGGRLGRRLVTPGGIVALEKGYMRFGTVGIFFCRLVPGLRSFVAPFSGLMDLSPARALIPMALASALWYGGLIYTATKVGNNWNRINEIFGEVNRTLAIAAIGVAVLIAVLWVAKWRRGVPNARLWRAIHRAFREDANAERRVQSDCAAAGAATLFLELAQRDDAIAPDEVRAIEASLRDRWGLTSLEELSGAHPVPPRGPGNIAQQIARRYDRDERLALAERLWRIARTDSTLSARTGVLMARAGELLGLSAEDLEEARQRMTTVGAERMGQP